jgi:Mn2+/Fe2+ NRAMP family transporter
VLYFPALGPHKYGVVIGIAVVVIGAMYGILLNGRYSLFEKVLVFFVTIMGISFIVSLAFVHPLPVEVARGLIPSIPEVPGGRMLVAAFVGTTMAAATFLSRPLFIQGKGWTMDDRGQQKRDAIIAALLVFVVSGSIMAVAHGALFHKQEPITDVLGMVGALEPVAGKTALTLFFFGTLSAGLSSVFPCLLIAPLLIEDYRSGKLDTRSMRFRIITGVASVLALAIPVFGYNPIKGQLLTQVFNVFVLPLVVAGIIVVINKRKLMGAHTAGYFLNIMLGLAFLFSVMISYNGILAIGTQLG